MVLKRFISALALTAVLGLGACSGDADVDIDADSADVNIKNDADTTHTLAPEPSDTAGGADVSMDGEGVEKMVEAALIASPGFAGVTVESEGEGMIVLNGTVASDAEKTNAETVAKGVSGVTSVKNNLTVQAAQ